MSRKRLKRMAAMMMAVVLTVCAATPAGSFAFASGVDVQSNTAEKMVTEESRELNLYDSTLRKELEAVEVATAVDIVVAAGYGFDVEHDFEGIAYNENAVSVSYYADKGSFNGNKAGEYETYYKAAPISGKGPYLICRTVSVREPETAKTAESSSDSGETENREDELETAEVQDLAEGEMPELTTDNPVTFRLTSEAVMIAASLKAAPASGKSDGKDSMKVSNNGYARYCGHSIGVKYISESGDYYHHLVFCLDMNKNTTSGTVSSSGNTSKIKPTITYCLVNGARKLNGTCHNSKYSSGNATQDYFITSAAIHVLNGKVGLSYYDNGSGTYSKISSLVSDAKKHGDDYADNGLTKSVTYSISPKKSEWKDMGDGLYQSADKFVRTKKGTITDVKYTITGAPAGLTVGEIKTDSSEIEDENDLKKYDICVAQTDAGKESSNFYLFCNADALKKIQEQKATIKVKGKAYADEKGGRKWTPTVVSQQKITFLEDFNVKADEATVKVTSEYKLGRLELLKTDKFTHSPIPGAKYYLYEDADCDDLFCKLPFTNDEGLAATDVEVLTQDTYYLKEVLEPDGYQKDETVYPVGLEYFTLYDGDGKVIQQGKQMPVKETPDRVGVLVNKTDSDSGNIVAGAGFAVFKDADKQHLPLGSVEKLSRALKVHDGRELVNYLRESGLNAYQMELVVDFYKKGVSLDKIREVMGQEQTAYSLSQALQKVYEALYQTGKNAEGNSGVQEIQGRIEAVVAQVGENKAFLDQVLSKLEEMDTGQNTDAQSQSFIEKLEEKDAIIKSQQEENNKLAADNAALRSRQGEVQETQEKQNEEMEKFRQEKTELLEQVKQAETDKRNALARLDAAGKEREAMKRKMEGMEREMEAVKKQLEQVKEKGTDTQGRMIKADSKRLAANYQALVSGPGGKQQIVEIERTERKNPAGIMALAGKLFKDKSRGKLLQTIAGAGMDSSQMGQVKKALQSGLTDEETINIIQCGFDAEQMGKAIEIVLLEKSY